MGGYLLDTNHLGAGLPALSVVRDRIILLHRAGSKFGTCMPVLCELEVGIQQTAAPEDYHRNLSVLLKKVRIWPIDRDTVRIFGETYLELRRRGRALSHVDIAVAALARQMKLTVLTCDRDFEALPDIHTENWLTLGKA